MLCCAKLRVDTSETYTSFLKGHRREINVQLCTEVAYRFIIMNRFINGALKVSVGRIVYLVKQRDLVLFSEYN